MGWREARERQRQPRRSAIAGGVVLAVLLATFAGSTAEPAGAASSSSKRPPALLAGLWHKTRITPGKDLVRPKQKKRPQPVAAEASRPNRGRVGFSGSLVWYEAAEQLAFLRRAHKIGVTWVREDLHWGAFERRRGEWNWSVGDRLMRNASLAGVDVLGMVGYSAPWAAAGPSIYYPPRNPAEYAEFCRRLVDRYGPGGAFWRANPELTPRPLTALEIWNEPWHSNWWRPNPDPAAYARLVRAAAVAIHGVNPSVKVLVSGDVFQMRSDTRESLDWFRLLLQTDPDLLRRHVDAYSIHLYTQARSPRDMRAQQRWRFDRGLITRDLAARAGASHPLWVTEFGWTTNAAHPDAVSEQTQALFVRQALHRTLGEWAGLVERSFLYHWGRPESDHVGGFGPLRADGSAKPVLGALASLLSG